MKNINSFKDASKLLHNQREEVIFDLSCARNIIADYAKNLREGKGTKYFYDESLTPPAIKAGSILSIKLIPGQALSPDSAGEAVITVIKKNKEVMKPFRLNEFSYAQIFEFERALNQILKTLNE